MKFIKEYKTVNKEWKILKFYWIKKKIVDIYFTAVGMIDIPTEKEILATMEEIRNNPQGFKFVA